MNRQEKIEQLKGISKKDAPNAKWKEIARWNEQHAACLDDLVIIATRIRSALKDKGLSQKELAAALEVCPQALTRIMKGRQNLSLQSIRRIEKVLNIRLISIHEQHEQAAMMQQKVQFVPVSIHYSTQSVPLKYKGASDSFRVGAVAEAPEKYEIAS